MRTLELGLLFVAFIALLWPVVFGVRIRRGVVPVLALTLLAAHLALEGFRWQMVPLYLVLVGLTVGDILFLSRTLHWSRRVARGVFGTIGLALAALLPLALPVPELPVPSGPRPVGTFDVVLVDNDRPEEYGTRAGPPRRLVAQVWYPASAIDGGERVKWSEDWDVVAPAMAENLGFPRWSLNHTGYTYSNSLQKLTPAPGSFPVIIYSHGWTGFRTIAVNQMEHLASNGYVVVAVDHTYGSIAVRFDEGDVVYHDSVALPEEETVEADVYQEAAEKLVTTFSDDIVAVLDSLELGRAGPFADLADSIDLDRVGLYGHSTGGGAAVKTCLVDQRCKAVLGMDAWVEPLAEVDLRSDLSVPGLFMRSDGWRDTPNDALLRGIAARGENVTYLLDISGAHHNDFVLTPLLSPLAANLGMKGPIAAGRILPIIDNYLLGFFDVYLVGTGRAALDSVSFDEVAISIVER